MTGHVAIDKAIPVAGGLAGGSADAAAALVALDRLWDVHTSDDDLLRIAGELGSDVPFALLGGTALGTGRGEIVEPLVDSGTWWWVLVPSAQGLVDARGLPALRQAAPRCLRRRRRLADGVIAAVASGRSASRWPTACTTTCRRPRSTCDRTWAS